MKKIFTLSLAILLIVSLSAKGKVFAYSAAPNEYKVAVNGSYLRFDVSPYVVNDRMLVPLRPIFEALGVPSDSVVWDGDHQTVNVVSGDGTTMLFTIGSTTAYLNSQQCALDLAPTYKNNRVFIPVRFIAENLGGSITWDSNTKTCWIDLE